MAESWEIVASFDNAVAAEMARNLLEGHGLNVDASNEYLVANAWNLSNAVGGIALRVPAADAARARSLLADKAPPIDDEAIAQAVAAQPEVAEQFPGRAEPFDDTPTDIEVDRVLKGTVFALLFPPVQVYTLYRLWMLRYADPPVRPRDRWKVRLAYALSLPLWFVVVVPTVLILGRFDPGTAAWQNERFGVGDVALTIDLPGKYGYDLRKEETLLGPAKVRHFQVAVRGQLFNVEILTLEPAFRPAEPGKAAMQFAERRYSTPGFRIERRGAIELGGYPGAEIVVAFNERITNRPCVVRERVYVVDRDIVVLGAQLAEADRDSTIAARFFRSARLR